MCKEGHGSEPNGDRQPWGRRQSAVRSIGWGFGLCLLVLCWSLVGARAENAGPSLETVLAEALARSEELYALRERVVVAEAMIRPAGALPDPMAQAGYQNIPVGAGLDLNQDMMSSFMLMLSQELPPSSRRRLLREAQGAEVDMVKAQLDEKRNDIIRKVKQAYLDIQYHEEALAIAEGNRAVAEDMLKLAESLYRTGKAMQQEVFQTQVRVSQMVDMVVMEQRERAMAVTRLNRLLYRDPTTELGDLPPLTRTKMDLKELGLRIESTNPQLAEMRARVTQAEKSAGVAESMIKPELTLSFSYMIREPLEDEPMSGDDMWTALVGINLPWIYRRDKVDEEVRGAKAEHRAATRDVEAMRNELVSMAEEMVLDVKRMEEQLTLVETGLLPQAEGAYAASRASYTTGMGDVLSLLDNQMNLYNLELQRIMLLRDRERALAEIEYLVGAGFSGEVNK